MMITMKARDESMTSVALCGWYVILKGHGEAQQASSFIQRATPADNAYLNFGRSNFQEVAPPN